MTGFILFFFGLITMTPEIYFSGIMVIFLSASIQLNDLEKHRLDEHGITDNTINYTDYMS